MESVVELSNIRKKLVISPTVATARFLEQRHYPYFFRTIPSMTQANYILLRLFLRWNWRRVVLFRDADHFFNPRLFQAMNIEIIADMQMDEDQLTYKNVRHSLENLKQLNSRIFVVEYEAKGTYCVLCAAYHLGMHLDAEYVWFLNPWLSNGWWKHPSVSHLTDCTEQEMANISSWTFTVGHQWIFPYVFDSGFQFDFRDNGFVLYPSSTESEDLSNKQAIMQTTTTPQLEPISDTPPYSKPSKRLKRSAAVSRLSWKVPQLDVYEQHKWYQTYTYDAVVALAWALVGMLKENPSVASALDQTDVAEAFRNRVGRVNFGHKGFAGFDMAAVPFPSLDSSVQNPLGLRFNSRNERVASHWVLKQNQVKTTIPIFWWSFSPNQSSTDVSSNSSSSTGMDATVSQDRTTEQRVTLLDSHTTERNDDRRSTIARATVTSTSGNNTSDTQDLLDDFASFERHVIMRTVDNVSWSLLGGPPHDGSRVSEVCAFPFLSHTLNMGCTGATVFVAICVTVLCLVPVILASLHYRRKLHEAEKRTRKPFEELCAELADLNMSCFPVLLLGFKCSTVAFFWCLAAMPTEGSMRARILPKLRQGKSRDRGRVRTTDLRMPMEAIVLNRHIGQGAFGLVFGGEAKTNETWEAVAVKVLNEKATYEGKIDFLSEAKLMRSLEHRNVVRLIGISLKLKDTLYLIMELMLLGDLKTYLLSRRILAQRSPDHEDIRPSTLTKMSIDIAQGVQYLHSKNLIHRDIACRNCLVGSDHVVKLGDFGLTREKTTNRPDGYYRFTRNCELPIRWMSPEAVQYGMFSVQSDIWSYGITVYEIVTFGVFPYSDMGDVEVVERVKRMEFGISDFLPPSARNTTVWRLIRLCCQHQYGDRPSSMKQVLQVLYDFPECVRPFLTDVPPKPNVVSEQLSFQAVGVSCLPPDASVSDLPGSESFHGVGAWNSRWLATVPIPSSLSLEFGDEFQEEDQLRGENACNPLYDYPHRSRFGHSSLHNLGTAGDFGFPPTSTACPNIESAAADDGDGGTNRVHSSASSSPSRRAAFFFPSSSIQSPDDEVWSPLLHTQHLEEFSDCRGRTQSHPYILCNLSVCGCRKSCLCCKTPLHMWSVWGTRTLSRLGQPGSIPALVLPSGGMAARRRKSVTAERFHSRVREINTRSSVYARKVCCSRKEEYIRGAGKRCCNASWYVTDRGSNLTSASRLLSRFEHPGSIPASGGLAARHREVVTVEGFILFLLPKPRQEKLRGRGGVRTTDLAVSKFALEPLESFRHLPRLNTDVMVFSLAYSRLIEVCELKRVRRSSVVKARTCCPEGLWFEPSVCISAAPAKQKNRYRPGGLMESQMGKVFQGLFLVISRARWLKWLERESTDRKVRGSIPTSASRLPLSRLGQPGIIPALVLPSGGTAARHREGVTVERFLFLE
ncbi:Insulin-like growth factor 1 receptor, variant 2 [Clonorchis sinensis]|uniref:Insulin-like growth factor 1 receptor, variant 2 n=2 Tax=Clonorchis sinensis TaxID=79923 RepID=A0A8T1MWF9_CLOSI|nr:Insulin-like growth factor 1 receptor, variant 2 [Clonorchis sinensis]